MQVTPLTEGWEVAGAERDRWTPARVPGTVSSAGIESDDYDAEDWSFRTRFDAEPGDDVRLRLDGVATLSEVFLNGERILGSESMFARAGGRSS